MRKIYLLSFFLPFYLVLLSGTVGFGQTWEVFDQNFNLEKKISPGNIYLLGNSLRINVWENDLSFLDPDYRPFITVDSASLYQYLEPWIIIKNNGKYGAFHEYGEQVLPPVYDEISTFYTHLLARKGQEYFIYDRGNRETAFIGVFASARIAKNGQVIAQLADSSYALPLSPTPDHRFQSLADPGPDAIVSQEPTGFGLINREGEYILDPIIDEINHLEGTYYFAKNEREYLLIDALSTDADIRYNSFHRISIEEEVIVEYIHGKLRRIMKNDGILLDILGMDSVRKINNHYNVHFKNATTGLLNSQGKWEVRPTAVASLLLPGYEGLFGAKMGAQFGYVDAEGNTVIDSEYDQVEPFSEGLAAVKSDSKWGYINSNNGLSIPHTYDWAGPFTHGVAIVKENRGTHLIDSSGNKLLPVSSDRISRTGDGYYLLEKEGLLGIANPNGQLISSPRFEEIRREGTDRILIRKGANYGVMRENGDYILPLYYSRILFDTENDKILAKSMQIEMESAEIIEGKKSRKKKNKGA